MSAKTFLWIEDRKGKAGYIFWSSLLQHLCPYICLESKKNNSELVKAVKSLEDTYNKYVIVFDNSFDNLQIVIEQKILKQYADKKPNVVLMDIICFEYILLEFKNLINWIYTPYDDFLKKRAAMIAAREKLVAKLLFDLTRNTGFEVSKGSIGDCWINSCCEWENRQTDDICGLDDDRRTNYDKMKSIYEGTCLKEGFYAAGLEVAE